METQRLDLFSDFWAVGRSRRDAVRALVATTLGLGTVTILGIEESAAKKKRKRRKGGRNRGKQQAGKDSGAAVVTSYCEHVSVIGSSRAIELGQPFIARRTGLLDRVELSARSGPGGQHVIEVRDLNQGQGISTAPVIGAATITVPAIAQGEGQLVTGQFGKNAVLTADSQYALVVRYLGAGDDPQYFQIAGVNDCAGPGVLLRKDSGETSFTPEPGLKLEYSVYVVP